MVAETGAINDNLVWRRDAAAELVTCTVMTLGPEGTSSEQAAKQMLCRQDIDDVQLFDSYEAAAEKAVARRANAALLVANAYHGINRFYIARELIPAAAFFFDTPSYVIAARDVARFYEIERPRIATHPAPAHRIRDLLIQQSHERVDVGSTSLAAQAAWAGEVDACLTTEIARQKYELQNASKPFPIPMLWTIFLPVVED